MKDEIKVTIGCRVTPEKRQELLLKAKQEGYNSFSQYLENLILKASSGASAIEPEPNTGETLDEFLERFALVFEFNDEGTEYFKDFFKEKFTRKEALEFMCVGEDLTENFPELLGYPYNSIEKLLFIEFTRDQKNLLTEYSDYLMSKNIAVSKAGAIIGSISLAMEKLDGGLFENGFPGRKKFLSRFKEQNEKILKN